jgi:hypothetical protein
VFSQKKGGIMKRLTMAIVVTGVVIAGAIITTVNVLKGSGKNALPEHEKAKELTSDFLL